MRFRVGSCWSLAALAVVLAACSSGDGGGGVEPTNHAPSITFQFNKIGIVKNIPVQLSVTVSDLDGDPVAVTWSVTRGTITTLNAAKTLAQWNVPNAVGVDSVTVRASDGTATSTVVSEIKVGSAFSGNRALARYAKNQSPYIVNVTGSPPVLAVTLGTTVIEPGTELLLETPGAVIDVTDSLLAIGTPTEPNVIRPNLRNLKCGDDGGWWQGFKVYTDFPVNGQLQLDYGQIWYGNWTVRLRDQGSAVVRNSELRCSGQAGVLHEGGGVLILEDTVIRDGAFDGIGVTSLTFQPDSIVVHACHIAFNGRTGIALELDDQLQEVPITIDYSDIEFNAEHGITLKTAVFPSIHYNRFFGNGAGGPNGLNHIFLFSGYPNGAGVTQLDAACNFWGAPVSNLSTIDAMIRDELDTATVGTRVIASPWSNENPLVTTSTCVWP